MTDLIWSFAPWLVFLGASRVTSLYGAVAAGAVAALVVFIRAIRRRRVHMLDVASTVYFVALGATLIGLHPGHLEYWAQYVQAGFHIALTLLVFGSILIGRPFTSWAFTSRAKNAGLLPSLGTVGDPYDNAVVESFWGRMQVELLNRQRWRTRVELANAIFEYIEGFHNRRRRHSYLGWASPLEFETEHRNQATAPQNPFLETGS
jgi:hypothetical protein